MIIFIILLGALALFFGFPNPYYQLEFLVLLYPVALYLIAKNSRQVFRDAWLCSLLGTSLSMYFIYNAVHIYGFFPWYYAVPCVIVMGAYIGLWGAVFAYFMKRMMIFSPFIRAFTAIFLFYILEWLRSYFLTGFPWLSLSSALAKSPEFIQLASIIGAFGLSGLYVGIAVLFAEGLSLFSPHNRPLKPKFFCFISSIILFGAIFAYGDFRLQNTFIKDNFYKGLNQEEPFKVKNQNFNKNENENFNYLNYYNDPNLIGLSRHSFLMPNFISKNAEQSFYEQNLILFSAIQGNISQAVKWNQNFQLASLLKYIRLGTESQNVAITNLKDIKFPHVFLLPETALPFFYGQNEFLTSIFNDFALDKILVFGSPGISKNENEANYYNRLYLLQNSSINFYDKRRLVPFGEFLPEIPFFPDVFKNLLQGLGGFTAGSGEQSLILKNKNQETKFSSLICYEAIFPHLAQTDIENGAEIFINVSNDAWYDLSSAGEQHLALSLMRAVEQNRFLVRAGNTGISSIVDNYGRVLAKTNLFEDASLSGYVIPIQEKTIFFHIYPYLPYFAMAILIIMFYFLKKREKKLNQKNKQYAVKNLFDDTNLNYK